MDIVIFDLDDTLILDSRARDEAMFSTLRRFNSPLPVEEALKAVREEWRWDSLRAESELAGVSSWEALWTDFGAFEDSRLVTRGLALQARVWGRLTAPSTAERASRTFREAREHLVRPVPWARPVLTRLASSCEVWCATNGSGWLQRRKIELAGLSDLVSLTLCSGEVGAVKSSDLFHRHVRRRLADHRARVCAVIGDSRESDGALAEALGARFVLVAAGQKPHLEGLFDCT